RPASRTTLFPYTTLFRSPPTLALAGEPSIAFQGGYIKSSEPVSGVVVGARDFKQLFGLGDVLYIRVLPAANVRVGDRLTLYRPSDRKSTRLNSSHGSISY